MNTAPGILSLLLASPDVLALVGTWQHQPSIHTRRPIPRDAGYPAIVIGPETSLGDADGLTSDRPISVRDVIVYGHQPDQLRDVEQLGYLARQIFHGADRHSLPVIGYSVVDVAARGPVVAPTDDETKAARRVEVTVRLRRKEE